MGGTFKERDVAGEPSPQHVSHTVFTFLVSILPEVEGFLGSEKGGGLARVTRQVWAGLGKDFLAHGIWLLWNCDVAARLSRAVPGGMPGSETLRLLLPFIIFQGPPGNPGIPGLTGADGPPVRIGSWKGEEKEQGGLGIWMVNVGLRQLRTFFPQGHPGHEGPTGEKGAQVSDLERGWVEDEDW